MGSKLQHLANKDCYGDKNRSTFAIFGDGGGRGGLMKTEAMATTANHCLFIYLYANSVMANYKRQLQQTYTIKTKRRKENKTQIVRHNIAVNTIVKTLLNFILITSQKCVLIKKKYEA